MKLSRELKVNIKSGAGAREFMNHFKDKIESDIKSTAVELLMDLDRYENMHFVDIHHYIGYGVCYVDSWYHDIIEDGGREILIDLMVDDVCDLVDKAIEEGKKHGVEFILDIS